MQTRPPKFDALQFERPDFDTLRERYTDLRARLDAAQKPSEQVSVISEWNELRRQLKSWTSLTHLKFNQDTSNEAFKQEREFSDEIQPKLTDLDSKIKEAIVGSPHRGDIENTYGAHAFALWQVALESFDIAIEAEGCQDILWVSGGKIVTRGSTFIPEKARGAAHYVRAQLRGEHGYTCTQPFPLTGQVTPVVLKHIVGH